MKIIIAGTLVSSTPSLIILREIFPGFTGFGANFLKEPKSHLYAPSTAFPDNERASKLFGANYFTRWPDYFKFEHDFTLIRETTVAVAIALYNAILDRPEPHEHLQLVGKCHGGTIALLLADVIRAGAGELEELDADVIAQKEKIRESKAIKSIRPLA